MKHTELPWHEENPYGEPYFEIWRGYLGDARRECIAEYIHKDNIEFICRACNSHYDLLEACKRAVFHIHGYTDTPIKIRKQLYRAITQAEGK